MKITKKRCIEALLGHYTRQSFHLQLQLVSSSTVFWDQCSAEDEHDKMDRKPLLEILNNICGGLNTSMNLA